MGGYIQSRNGKRYICAACKKPIFRGTRCSCARGWILIEVDARGNPTGESAGQRREGW